MSSAKTLFSLLLVGGITAGASSTPTAPVTTSELPDFRAMAATPDQVKSIGKSDLLGHVWVADFIFTTCGDLCPRMTHQMRKLQSRLSPDVLLVSFTIDPDKDSLKDLQGYARDIDADPNRWFFLRMDKKRLAQLMSSGFKMVSTDRAAYEKNATNATLTHNSRFVLVDARGRVRAYYDGLNEDSLGFVVAAANILRNETSLSLPSAQTR